MVAPDTISLFAALNVLTGLLIVRCPPQALEVGCELVIGPQIHCLLGSERLSVPGTNA